MRVRCQARLALSVCYVSTKVACPIAAASDSSLDAVRKEELMKSSASSKGTFWKGGVKNGIVNIECPTGTQDKLEANMFFSN